MSSAQTITLYTLLLKKGFSEAEAKEFVSEIVTKEEAKEILLTKTDALYLEKRLTTTMYQVAFGTAGLTVAGVTVVLQIFFAG